VGERVTDLSARVGSVVLPNPVMTASGTAGHGTELAAYLDLGGLGAVVVKSLAAFPWAGNPAPRLHPAGEGMLNSVGLQGPGVEAWLADVLPALLATGARVVASIWGRTVEEFAAAAAALAAAPAGVVAVEVNVSCPNLEDRRRMFAHSPSATRDALAATAACGRPRWAKLSPNAADLAEVAAAAREGGAEAVTLVNTLLGMAIDPDTRRPRLGGGGGGLSGPPLRPVALRAVWDVHAALPDLPIVGVGGVARAEHAAHLGERGDDAGAADLERLGRTVVEAPVELLLLDQVRAAHERGRRRSRRHAGRRRAGSVAARGHEDPRGAAQREQRTERDGGAAAPAGAQPTGHRVLPSGRPAENVAPSPPMIRPHSSCAACSSSGSTLPGRGAMAIRTRPPSPTWGSGMSMPCSRMQRA